MRTPAVFRCYHSDSHCTNIIPLCTAFQTDLNRLVAVPGLQEGVRHRPKRVQTSEDQEGPERAEAAVISLLPILTGREAKGQGRTSQLQHMRSR